MLVCKDLYVHTPRNELIYVPLQNDNLLALQSLLAWQLDEFLSIKVAHVQRVQGRAKE